MAGNIKKIISLLSMLCLLVGMLPMAVGASECSAHSYRDGICQVCGKSAIDLSYATLSVENEVFYNIYFTLDDPALDPVEMGLLLGEQTLPGYAVEGDFYCVQTDGIPAKALGDDLNFQVYAKLADGTVIYSKTAVYSTARYARNVLSNSADAGMKALVVALLNYGTAAQSYFGHNTDAPLNGILTETEMALAETYRADMMESITSVSPDKLGQFAKTEEGFLENYPTVSCEGSFAINYYFTPAFTPEGEVTFYYWTQTDYRNAEVLTAENASGTMAMTAGENGQYAAEYTDIAAKHLDQTLYVAAVYEHAGKLYSTGVLPYSLGAYCTSSAVNSADAAMVEVGRTAVVYGYYAKQYFRVIAGEDQYVREDGTVLQPGESMPQVPRDGDVYFADGYIYKYGYVLEKTTLKPGNTQPRWVDAELAGWSVAVQDRSHTSYGEIRTSIGGAPVVSMRYTFADCVNMTKAPLIPKTIKDMTGTFYGCTALTGEVTVLAQFDEVLECKDSCLYCNSYQSLGCEKCLRCGVWVDCFAGTVLPISLRGTCNRQYELAATSENGNVKVMIPAILPVEPPLKPEIM